MRVLIITTATGGPKNWAFGLREALGNEHEVRVIWKPVDILRSYFFMHRYDVIHSIQPLPWIPYPSKTIINPRGDYRREQKLSQVTNYLYPLSLWQARHVIVPSKYLKKKLGLKKAIVIPNAIDPKSVRVKKDYSIKGKPRLVTVTNFGIREKAESVLELIEHTRPYELHIYGGGKYFEEMRRKGSIKSVVFHGLQKDVKNKLTDYDIFVYHSRLDNLPNAVIEAMAAGMPIVTTDVGAVGELIKNGSQGVIIPTADFFSKAIKDVLRSTAHRKKLAESATRKILDKHSWQSISKKVLRHYERIQRAHQR